jgi:hypothetical protein
MSNLDMKKEILTTEAQRHGDYRLRELRSAHTKAHSKWAWEESSWLRSTLSSPCLCGSVVKNSAQLSPVRTVTAMPFSNLASPEVAITSSGWRPSITSTRPCPARVPMRTWRS